MLKAVLNLRSCLITPRSPERLRFMYQSINFRSAGNSLVIALSMGVILLMSGTGAMRAQTVSEPQAKLVDGGSMILCDPIRAGRVQIFTEGFDATDPGDQAAIVMWLMQDDHFDPNDAWFGGTNQTLEWVEALVGVFCDPFIVGDNKCTGEFSPSFNATVAQRYYDPNTQSGVYKSFIKPLPVIPSPGSGEHYALNALEISGKYYWLMGVERISGSSGGGVLLSKLLHFPHLERSHEMRIGFETKTRSQGATVTIHRSWLMGPEYSQDFWGQGNFSSWPDYCQIELNSPPPTMKGFGAPQYFCGHQNTLYPCYTSGGTGPVQCFDPQSFCPTPTHTPTVIPTSTPSATPTMGVPTPTCPVPDPAVCLICRNNCILCKAFCDNPMIPNRAEYCQAHSVYCSTPTP
jgi:hypothetical protein